MLNQLETQQENLAKLNVPSSSILSLSAGGQEIIRFERNGDIYIKGNLTTNDMEVVEGFRELLLRNNLSN